MTATTWEYVRRADIRPEFERARRALKGELAGVAPAEAAARLTALATLLDQRVEGVKANLLAASLCWNDDYQVLVAWLAAEHQELFTMALATSRRAAADEEDFATMAMSAAALYHFAEATKWDTRRASRDFQPLHALMADAFGADRARRAVRITAAGRERSVTLEALYIRALLLDRFAGGSLTRSQLEILDAWLWEWTPALAMTHEAPGGRSFHVDVDSSGALRQASPAPGASVLYLPLQPLLDCRRAVIGQFHRGQLVPQQGCAAQMRIEEHLAVLEQTGRAFDAVGSQSRAERRQATKIRVETWVGLDEILAAAGPARAGHPDDDPSRRYLWLNDASGSGVGFEALSSDAEGIEVGDLIGWRKSADEPCCVGRVARRMPGSAPGQVYFGVELLSAAVQAVELVEFAGDRTLAGQPFIFVAGEEESGRRDAFLLPEVRYRDGTVFHARFEDRTFLLRIDRLRQRGRGWVLAGFEVLVPELTSLPTLPDDLGAPVWNSVDTAEDSALEQALAREMGSRLLG